MKKQTTFKNIIQHRIFAENRKMINGQNINFSTDEISEKYYEIKNLFLLKHAEKFFNDKNILANVNS